MESAPATYTHSVSVPGNQNSIAVLDGGGWQNHLTIQAGQSKLVQVFVWAAPGTEFPVALQINTRVFLPDEKSQFALHLVQSGSAASNGHSYGMSRDITVGYGDYSTTFDINGSYIAGSAFLVRRSGDDQKIILTKLDDTDATKLLSSSGLDLTSTPGDDIGVQFEVRFSPR